MLVKVRTDVLHDCKKKIKTRTHDKKQVRQDSNENASAAQAGAREVKTLKREVKTLNQKLRRQEYLTKKQARATEAAESSIQQAVQRVITLENDIGMQQSRTRKQLLAEFADDVQNLKQRKRNLQKSVETWSTRYNLNPKPHHLCMFM